MADSKAQAENTCHCCLYLKPPPDARQATRGNCSLQTHGEWLYIRRKIESEPVCS